MRYDDGLRAYETSQALRGRDAQPGAALARDRERLVREELAKRYQTNHPCEACDGHRLPEALAVKIGGRHISEVAEFSVDPAGSVVRGRGAST